MNKIFKITGTELCISKPSDDTEPGRLFIWSQKQSKNYTIGHNTIKYSTISGDKIICADIAESVKARCPEKDGMARCYKKELYRIPESLRSIYKAITVRHWRTSNTDEITLLCYTQTDKFALTLEGEFCRITDYTLI